MKCKPHVNILNIPFLNTTKDQLLRDYLAPRLNTAQKTFVVTANPEIVMETKENVEYSHAIQSADYIVPDGIGIIFAAKMQKTPLLERIPGVELMADLLNYANDHQLCCYFLGATEDINQRAVSKIQQQYPNLIVGGRQHGYFDFNDGSIAEHVAKTSPDIIFVALGLPRQEKWIAQSIDKFDKGLFIGVGGSFDVFAGAVKRAPDRWVRFNLEWLYRIIQQPSRIFRAFSLVKFVVHVLFNRQ